jgi:hypothetical protein
MTQEKVGFVDAQSFRSWERLLTPREGKIARELCVVTWCEGIPERRIELRGLARAAHTTPRHAEEALRSLYEKGALSRLQFIAPGLAVVALTPRWRMDEEGKR